jgi:putative transposase
MSIQEAIGVPADALPLDCIEFRICQIEKQRAVNKFRQLATNENPNIQMILPMADIVGLLQQGVGHLLREAGLALMSLGMEEEVRPVAGERNQQHEERRAHRWGKEDGFCVIDGQKVPIVVLANHICE